MPGQHAEDEGLDYGSSEEDIRESGAGILEFSTAKAGLDITPANYDFQMRDDRGKKSNAGFSNLAGQLWAIIYDLLNRKQTLSPFLILFGIKLKLIKYTNKVMETVYQGCS